MKCDYCKEKDVPRICSYKVGIKEFCGRNCYKRYLGIVRTVKYKIVRKPKILADFIFFIETSEDTILVVHSRHRRDADRMGWCIDSYKGLETYNTIEEAMEEASKMCGVKLDPVDFDLTHASLKLDWALKKEEVSD